MGRTFRIWRDRARKRREEGHADLREVSHHPVQGPVRQAALIVGLGISASDIAVCSGKQSLSDIGRRIPEGGFEVIASFVQGHCMEAHAHFLAQLGIDKLKCIHTITLARIVRKSHRPDRIPDRDGSEAVDRSEIPVLQRATGNKSREVARHLSKMGEAERIDDRGSTVPIPGLCAAPIGAFLILDNLWAQEALRCDETGQRACRIRAAAEADNHKAVARCIISGEKRIPTNDTRNDARAECTAEQFIQEIARISDAMNVFRDERRLTIFNERFFLFIGIQQRVERERAGKTQKQFIDIGRIRRMLSGFIFVRIVPGTIGTKHDVLRHVLPPRSSVSHCT